MFFTTKIFKETERYLKSYWEIELSLIFFKTQFFQNSSVNNKINVWFRGKWSFLISQISLLKVWALISSLKDFGQKFPSIKRSIYFWSHFLNKNVHFYVKNIPNIYPENISAFWCERAGFLLKMKSRLVQLIDEKSSGKAVFSTFWHGTFSGTIQHFCIYILYHDNL